MLTVRLRMPAENVMIDQQTDEVAAIGIMPTGVKAVAYPLLMRRLCYLVFWEKLPEDPSNYDGFFSLTLEQTVIAQSAITLNFGQDVSHRTLVRIEGVVIQTPGTLEFSIVAGGVTASYAVDARTVQAIPVAVPSPSSVQ